MNPQPIIRRAEERDLDAVTRVHLESFPGFFLSCLGPRFLRLLYQEILNSTDGVLIVAEDGGCVIGFAAGTTTQMGFYRSLLRRRAIGFAFAALPYALRRPIIVPRLLRALRRPAESAGSSAAACLMSLAVDPAAGGTGIGGRLVGAFCDELRARGSERVCLTTDAVGNDGVNRFYIRQGFCVAQRLTTPEGRALNEYVMDL
jgi:ribosomal protein S18 acetylase RimI-like enzyme